MTIQIPAGWSSVKHPLRRLRYWLIVKLTGDDSVMINVDLTPKGFRVRNGMLIVNSSWTPGAL